MTKIQIVKIANSLEMFWICFFLKNLDLICHLEFMPKKTRHYVFPFGKKAFQGT